jgi:hypothetical protein
VAEREAEVAFQNAVLRKRRKMDYSTLPWATFLDPEVATVGISEAHAVENEQEHRVFRASYADIDRARIDARTEGLAKVVASPSGKILGATILGAQASLVLQQIVLAMESNLGLGDLARATQIYPSYSQVVRDLAEQFMGARQESGLRATALRLFFGFQPKVHAVNGGSTHATGGSHAAHDAVSQAASHTEHHGH